MDIRYTHPRVTELWSDEWTFEAWLDIERQVLRAQRELWVKTGEPNLGAGGSGSLLQWLGEVHINDSAAGEIRAIERTQTKHDVGAFLVWLRDGAPSGQYLHFGLTSSDLVDTTQAIRFKRLEGVLFGSIQRLLASLDPWLVDNTPLAGRTHGQPAEPTSVSARAWHWKMTLMPAWYALLEVGESVQTAKLSGPVGTFAHNPPEIEQEVARQLGIYAQGLGSSQVVPRSNLALWASAAAALVAACNKVATDLRLMNLLGQVSWPKSDGQVGSSAMAQKTNPIIAEQIKGMSQMATGYAAMLQPLDLWLERDISNSSVERVAVPDLWHILLHTLKQTATMLETAVLDRGALARDLEENFNALRVHKTTLEEVAGGSSIEEAREFALSQDHESYDFNGGAAWFTRRHPGRSL